MPLTILAKITATAGHEARLRKELIKLIAITRSEDGCLQYDLHEDTSNPCIFVFYELWQTRELWQDHMNAPHLAAFAKAVEGAIIDFELNEMNQIDA